MLMMLNEQSNLTISDVHISNMRGTTSGRRDPNVGTIVCSSPDVSLPFAFPRSMCEGDLLMGVGLR